MPKLILMVGLPRSGKSTKALQYGVPVVSPDAIRLALTGERFNKNLEVMVWPLAKVMVRSLFAAGHEIVVLDATNTTRERRDFWRSRDWTRVYEFVSSPVDECIARAIATNQEDLIPVIRQMHENYEDVTPEEID